MKQLGRPAGTTCGAQSAKNLRPPSTHLPKSKMYREVDGEEVVLERDSNYEITYEDLLTYAEWYECPRLRLNTCKSMACQL